MVTIAESLGPPDSTGGDRGPRPAGGQMEGSHTCSSTPVRRSCPTLHLQSGLSRRFWQGHSPHHGLGRHGGEELHHRNEAYGTDAYLSGARWLRDKMGPRSHPCTTGGFPHRVISVSPLTTTNGSRKIQGELLQRYWLCTPVQQRQRQ